MDAVAVNYVQTVPKIGEELLKNFAGKERFVKKSKLFTYPLQKANLPTFITQSKKILSKDKAEVETLKEDRALFSGFYVACHGHDGMLEEFFKYENQPWPPTFPNEQSQRRTGSSGKVPTSRSSNTDHSFQMAPLLFRCTLTQKRVPSTGIRCVICTLCNETAGICNQS